MPNGRNRAPAARKGGPFLLAALLLALFLWGAEQVAVMPLQTGEVYPLYSSLRADPLGALALYESLAALPELDVSRLYKDRPTLDPGATLLVLGVDPAPWYEFAPEQLLSGYEHSVAKGGRIVVAFLPINSLNNPADAADAKKSQDPDDPDRPQRLVPVKDRWGIRLVYRKPAHPSSDIPRVSALSLDPGPEWTVLATRAGLPSAAAKHFGAGSIVLFTDSYLLSNEGLRESRNPELIASLLGSARRIEFDENHLGVADEGGVAVLLRKYRLEGALAVLLLAVALFIWASASSFLPPREQRPDDTVAGRDAQEGLAALLRRGVPEKDLLDTCFREWSRSAPSARVARNVEEEIARWRGRDPLDAYRAAQATIAEKR
jgi:hypothetical protein